MKSILCFGDSNTYGIDILSSGRLPREQRWTGILQSALGEDYYIIEEGLNGRTTVFDDPFGAWRNGLSALPMVLQTHIPLELVVVMLGTNDVKPFFSASAAAIARGARSLCKAIQRYDYDMMNVPKILLVSPIQVGKDVETGPLAHSFDISSYKKSLELARYYEMTAQEMDCNFFDAAAVASPSPLDKIHLDEAGHEALAKALAKEIIRMRI